MNLESAIASIGEHIPVDSRHVTTIAFTANTELEKCTTIEHNARQQKKKKKNNEWECEKERNQHEKMHIRMNSA